jgi:hypothetical protein
VAVKQLEEKARMMRKRVEELDGRLAQVGGDAAGVASEIDVASARHRETEAALPAPRA